jgi:dTMP kinase
MTVREGMADGAALACLVVADRHHHLAKEVVPHLAAGITVVCDRYVASTLVVQALDGVPQDYLLALNSGLRMPDLAVILTADPRALAGRIAERGATHRFNRDPSFPARESALYGEAAELLRGMGVPVLVIDTGSATPKAVAEQITAAALGLGNVHHLDSATAPTQGATPA